jgi:hypothetical protein
MFAVALLLLVGPLLLLSLFTLIGKTRWFLGAFAVYFVGLLVFWFGVASR